MSSANQYLPETSVRELAPGAAFAAAGNADVVVFMGPAPRGTINAPLAITAQNQALLRATYGNGPMVKEADRFLAKVGQPIVVVRTATASVPGALGAVTVDRTTTGTAPTNTISGTPLDGADVLITYTLGGVTGTGPITYTVALDGETQGAPVSLGTGTTITVLGVVLALGSGKTITTGDTTAWLQTVASSTIRPLTFAGSGTSVITATGTPLDAYEVEFEVVTGGTIGTPGIVFRYTLDADAIQPVWSAFISLNTATSFLLLDGPLSTESTGVTLNFAAGTLAALDALTFGTSSPAYDSPGATAALGTLSPAAGLLGWNGTWTWIRMVGPVTASLAGSIDSIVTGFDAANHPSWAVVDYRDRAGGETNAAHSLRFQADFANYTSTHVGVTFGLCRYTDTVNGRNNRHSPMGPIVPRAQAYAINVNWGMFTLGPLTADVTIFDAGNNLVEHDANADNGPNSMGAITLRTWPSQSGVYPTQACLMGPDTDIKLVPLRRVMALGMQIQFQVEQLQILQNPPVYVSGDKRGIAGNLVETYARRVERIAKALIGTALGSLVSGFTFALSRTPIPLGGGNYKVTFTFKIQPVVYIVKADGTAQFTNPSLDIINQSG